MSSLAFFESAARLGNFTKAAEELCVTQSAVSKKIKILEEWLGFDLFVREPRQLILTEAGHEFYGEAKSVLRQMTESVGRIRRYADANAVTVTCTQAVSHYWLFPRITRFNLVHPDIAINIYASNEISEDMCSQFDLGVLNGTGEWRSEFHSHLLFVERIYPVCHNDYPVDRLLTPEQLLNEKLIHLDPSVWRWPTWIDWFASFGIDYEIPVNAQVFNQITLALEATRQGMGVGLGWEFMTEQMIERHELKRVSTHFYAPNMADFLVYRKSKELSDAAKVFRDWLLADVSCELESGLDLDGNTSL
ncbi:LysR family transcriptional regulator [Pontibacterium granulatum]|uniref:LysR family transcriptional regulator n=1 Tax=Pontibacterium granulatum TaxID=2036029 RepID=UPI00249C7204|nr:LysR family transcriptional regulator [Pontibacterium granulatum]MDI3326317.1 LysR family transcriptional regulator [Pontibacterium granulatum]